MSMGARHPAPDPINVVISCIPGMAYYVPNTQILDARLRDLNARIQLNAHIPALVYRFECDVEALILHRAWMTWPVDPNAREHCDQEHA